MEYSLFTSHLSNYLPPPLNTPAFKSFLTPSLLSSYADLLMYTLPKPRYSYYQVNDY